MLFSAKDKVRLGFIGVGLRGRSHVGEGLLRDDVDIVAICDTQESSLQYCGEQFNKAGKALPKEYTGSIDAYKRLLMPLSSPRHGSFIIHRLSTR